MSSHNGKSPSGLLSQAVGGGASLAAISQLSMRLIVLIIFVASHSGLRAQAQVYAGVLGGVSTLSGDARSLLSPGSTNFSVYDPKNGLALEILLGNHFSDYFALQADYVWKQDWA